MCCTSQTFFFYSLFRESQPITVLNSIPVYSYWIFMLLTWKLKILHVLKVYAIQAYSHEGRILSNWITQAMLFYVMHAAKWHILLLKGTDIPSELFSLLFGLQVYNFTRVSNTWHKQYFVHVFFCNRKREIKENYVKMA